MGQEDCLFLNVWSPLNVSSSNKNMYKIVENKDSLLPVMFYIHGGSLVEGSGNDIGQTPWRPAT